MLASPLSSSFGAIRAFAFDLDETLIDCSVHHEDATRDLLVATGIEAERVEHVWTNITGLRTRDIIAAFRDAAGLSHDVDDLLATRTRAFREALLRLPPALLPGAHECLAQARAIGPVSLVTSGHHGDVESTLEATGIREVFAHIITGEDVDRPKPDAQPYALAAERMGVEPAEVLAFEDSVFGVRAAKAAGCRVIAVPNAATTPRAAVAQADFVIDTMTSILPLDRFLRRM